ENRPHLRYDSIALKERELARSLREMSAVDPAYASLRLVSIAEIDSVQADLPETTTLVEYFTTGDEVLAFIISRNDAKVVRKLCSTNAILKSRARLRFQLESLMLGPDYLSVHSTQIFESARFWLQDLYQRLMAPFIRKIQSPHLIIVPH